MKIRKITVDVLRVTVDNAYVVTRQSPHPEMTKNVSGHGVSLGPFRLFS
jgi:hypothetical protein